MNGNSLYKLRDKSFNSFLNVVERDITFGSWNYDTFIMRKLKQDQQFFQENAHNFVYTEVIQHGQNDILVSEVLERYPNTYLLHQARYAL
jgi:hypothetical protein